MQKTSHLAILMLIEPPGYYFLALCDIMQINSHLAILLGDVMPNTVVVKNPAQLGQLVRATRKHQGLRQDEVGRLSHSFIGEVEMGKPTAQFGKVMQTLRELGIKLHVELPPGVDAREFEQLWRSAI